MEKVVEAAAALLNNAKASVDSNGKENGTEPKEADEPTAPDDKAEDAVDSKEEEKDITERAAEEEESKSHKSDDVSHDDGMEEDSTHGEDESKLTKSPSPVENGTSTAALPDEKVEAKKAKSTVVKAHRKRRKQKPKVCSLSFSLLVLLLLWMSYFCVFWGCCVASLSYILLLLARQDYPKRPLSAYNIFFKENREKIITEHGKTNFQDMVRKIAANWKDVNPEDKKRYEEEAAKDLARYKDQVSVYEKEMVEKNRKEREEAALLKKKAREEEKKFHQKKMGMMDSGVPVGRFAAYDDDGTGAMNFSRGYGRFPFGMGAEEAMMASVASGGTAGADLSSRDLEAARRRLEADLRGIEEARAIRLRQLELEHMQSGSGLGASALRGGGMFGAGGLGDSSDLALQRRYLSAATSGLAGGDPLAMANEAELRKRLSMMRNSGDRSSEEHEQLLRESNFGSSFGSSSLGRLNPYSSSLGMGMGAMGGMGIGGMSGMGGLGNQYEEILLREQMLRREREILLGGGAGSSGSAFGGSASGFGGGGLSSLGLGSSSGFMGGSAAAASADLQTSAAAAGLASLRGQSSYLPGSHLERLTDEELRALSAGRRPDATDGEKGEK